MGVEQAATSSSSLRNLHIISRIPKSPSVIHCPNLFPSVSPYKSHSYRWNGCLKCSMNDYKDQFYANNDRLQPQVSYPKPSVVPWMKELCNSVNLIGVVAVPVEIKHFPSGKVVAWTRLAVKKNATQSFWINLTFWDELAHVAFQHVEKRHQIYVSGRLVTDTVQSNLGKQQTYYKVFVQQLNFIDRSQLPALTNNRESDSVMTAFISDRKGNSGATNNTGSAEELWQLFFANPEEWWDNRKKKRNPKYPDFKHKDTGEALWVEGRSNPPWVKSQLEIMDARMELFPDQNAKMLVNKAAADEFLSF
ncbi:protein OSB1, mitochondrial-like isoform X3 [Prosopis cineraria]|uniref:protein OSB1, mitochondrial-like isoform X3 n=1 Tax=Prosopis cineraria TaxID=364024 RepID=UPI0024106F68|nr:protein OSB1, mitochondrial-like isoform X3 [Prosopis cineraria]